MVDGFELGEDLCVGSVLREGVVEIVSLEVVVEGYHLGLLGTDVGLRGLGFDLAVV